MFTRIDTSGPDVRLCLYGVFDSDAARSLHGAIEAVAEAPRGDLLLDLSGVEGIDDSGLRALAFLARRLAARRRRLRLTGIAGPMMAPLRDVGLADPTPSALPLPPMVAAPRRRRASLMH
jgi:anti-anti-sigma regulatory factor